MKKQWLICVICALLSITTYAQLQNQSSFITIPNGSFVIAQNGVLNNSGATLTVDGALSTPADLSNTAGATLQGDGHYNIGGNWTNEANFNAGTSTVTFEGAQNSTVISGGNAFYLLVLNKSGGNNLLLADDVEVTHNFDFQASDNFAILENNNLKVADITGYDATRHVRTDGAGFLIRNVSTTPVDFPVGNTAYNPATLTNAGTPDFYLVRVSDAVLSGGDTGSPITVDAVGRGWFVEENTAGGSDLSLALQWNGADEQATFDRTNAYVSHFLAGSWDTQPTASASGADPYSLSRSGITSLSPFAVFDGDFTALIDISGIILWEHDGTTGVKDANVALTGDDTDADISDVNGSYALTTTNGSNFTVTPTKNINKLNGITVADALAIQQHVTGVNPITSPYKQVAADVNKSNSITTFDATIINQSLLGNPAALAQFKTAWRFVPADYNLSIPPWGFPEKIDLTGVSGSMPDQDFLGIKTGDLVAAYANPTNLVPPPPLVLRTTDATLQAGQNLEVRFRTDQFEDLAAWQFALGFDPERLELSVVEPLGRMPVSEDNFGHYQIAKGELRSVWSQSEGMALAEGEAVFQLKFRILQSGGKLSDALWLNETALPALAYNSVLAETGVTLRFDQLTGVHIAEKKEISLEVWPNPFEEKTAIQFTLPEAAEVQVEIFDLQGKHMRMLQAAGLSAGQHTVLWDGKSGSGDELPAGSYLVRLVLGDKTLVKQAVLIR